MRIRTIKPEFWRSDDITALSREHRLLFIGLWSYVDDNGVGIDDYRRVAADLFAFEEDQKEIRDYIREGLATLSRVLRPGQGVPLITRYTVDGVAYFYITAWTRHQRVDRPNQPRYPLPSDGGGEPPTSNDGPDAPGNEPALATPSREPRETIEQPHRDLDTGRNAATGTDRTKSDDSDSSGDCTANGVTLFDTPSDLRFPRHSRDPREDLAIGTEEQRNRGTEEQGKQHSFADAHSSPLADARSSAPRRRGAASDADPPGFPEFWDACPRKIGKGAARKAFTAAGKRSGLDAATLTGRMAVWAEHWRRTQTDERFVPHPATWLNQGRYDDPPPNYTPAVRVPDTAANGGLGEGTTAERVSAILSLKRHRGGRPA